MYDKRIAFHEDRGPAAFQGPFVRPRSAHALLIVAVGLLNGCGQSPPSRTEADAAVKQLPELQLLVGTQINNPGVHLVSDLRCSKSGDQMFLCQVLLPKNPLNGMQQTVPVQFTKLDGQWRASSAN